MKSFFLRPHWSYLDKAMFYIGAVSLLVLFFSNQIGKLEGRLFPVVRDFQIHSVEAKGAGSLVGGDFTIIRPKCSFVQVNWILRGKERQVPLDITFLDGPKLRKGGRNHFSNWVLNIPADKLDKTIAEVVHQCPWRPWLTISHLYP